MSPGPAVTADEGDRTVDPRLVAAAAVLSVGLLVGTTVFWSVETVDYRFDVDEQAVQSAPAAETIDYHALPDGAQRAMDAQLDRSEEGFSVYRTTMGEVRRLDRYRYVERDGRYYRYRVTHDHDALWAFGRSVLVAAGAVGLLLAAAWRRTDRYRPLTAGSAAALPVVVGVALLGAAATDLSMGRHATTVPEVWNGPFFALTLAVVLAVGALARRAGVRLLWVASTVFLVGATRVGVVGYHYVTTTNAPVSLWLVLTVLAGLVAATVVSPVAGVGYVLAAPPDEAADTADAADAAEAA